MKRDRPSRRRARGFALWLGGWLLLFANGASAGSVILYLHNGDRLAGVILTEDTNRVVLSTGWISELPVPLSAIQRREIVTNAIPPGAATTPSAGAGTNAPAAVSTPVSTTRSAAASRWKARLDLGLDTKFGAQDRELYTSRLKMTYEQPYKSNSGKFFRSIFDYALDYGKTDGVKSADRMYGSVKTDFDVATRVFVYNLAGGGYDEIRKIDREYEAGPGAGYRLFTATNCAFSVEAGVNYQAQERATGDDVENFYYRLANNLTWKLTSRLTLEEKLEWFPKVNDPGEYRARLDATLRYALWQNISFSLSVLDLYDTDPATGVDKNEVMVRSLVGVSF